MTILDAQFRTKLIAIN